jgi:hypothetical protein
MKIPQILDAWAALQQAGKTVQVLRARLHRSNADARGEYERDFLADRVFQTHDDLHKRKVLRDIEGRTLKARQTALSVALDGVLRPLRAFERDVSAFRVAAMRAPHPIDAWLALSGGQRQFLKDADELLAEVAHEQRLTRLLFETKDWPPSRWHAEYERATAELAHLATVRSAASFLMFAESMHGNGWTGPKPLNGDEEAAAVSLRKQIAATQHARVPAQVAEIEAGIAELKKLAVKAQTLDRINPISPAIDSEAKFIYDEELAAESEGVGLMAEADAEVA